MAENQNKAGKVTGTEEIEDRGSEQKSGLVLFRPNCFADNPDGVNAGGTRSSISDVRKR